MLPVQNILALHNRQPSYDLYEKKKKSRPLRVMGRAAQPSLISSSPRLQTLPDYRPCPGGSGIPARRHSEHESNSHNAGICMEKDENKTSAQGAEMAGGPQRHEALRSEP